MGCLMSHDHGEFVIRLRHLQEARIDRRLTTRQCPCVHHCGIINDGPLPFKVLDCVAMQPLRSVLNSSGDTLNAVIVWAGSHRLDAFLRQGLLIRLIAKLALFSWRKDVQLTATRATHRVARNHHGDTGDGSGAEE